MGKRYDIIYQGKLVAGSQQAQVVKRLADYLKMTPEQLHPAFHQRTIVVAQNLEEAPAREILGRMKRLGAMGRVRPAQPPPAQAVPQTSPESTSTDNPLWGEDSPFQAIDPPGVASSATSPQAGDEDDFFAGLPEPPADPPEHAAPAKKTPPPPLADENPFVPIGSKGEKGPPPGIDQLESLDLAAAPPLPPTPPLPSSNDEVPASSDVFEEASFFARQRKADDKARETEHRHRAGCVVFLTMVTVVCCVFCYWWWERNRLVSQPPGVRVVQVPVQQNLEKVPPFLFKGHLIKPIASFELEAMVLSYRNYDSEVMPLDLALGWGRMSDTQVLEHISIRQYNRFYFWSTSVPPIPYKEIIRSSANMHLVPANKQVANRMDKARRGHIITLSGFLIQMKGPDGVVKVSSITREDSGPGACEIIWVEDFEIL